MKILQINSFCGAGSTGRIAAGLSQSLRAASHECLIAYGRDSAPAGIPAFRIGTKADNYLHALRSRIFDDQGFGSVRATRGLIAKIEEYGPDLIHLHNLHGYYLNLEILFDYLSSAGKSVVWTLHDCWAFTGHCAYFDYVGCEKWKTGCGRCPQKNRYPASRLADRSKRNYERKKRLFTSVGRMTIVTPSQWLADLAGQSFLSRFPTQVIQNGIDLQAFQPTDSDFRDRHRLREKFIVLGVANVWDERKGLDYFAELSKILNSGCKIVLVGVTEKQRKSLPGSILCIPRTDSIKELAEIYTAADVFVNPTLEEVFGLVNVEALACGTPVVTFDTGGSPEAIDESCGLVVKKENLKALCAAVEQVRRKQFADEACRGRAKLFDAESSYSEYLRLYDGMLHKTAERRTGS